MDPDKKDEPTSAPEGDNEVKSQDTPADALSMTPEELEEQRTEQAASDADLSDLDALDNTANLSPAKKFMRKVNVYFLGFGLILATVGAIAIVSFLNSQQEASVADIEGQSLNEEALQQLANTDANVGASSQTLTIQGNAVISGQTLARGDLNVAGNLQTGGSIQGPSLTISGTANLSDAQINNLQVASNTTIQGSATIGELSVAGNSSFNGPVTASQLTVTRLIMSGNASLEVPNHISFTGASPNRTVNNGILGTGGSASINGSDTAGTINVNSGNSPNSGCFMRVTFNQQFSGTPHVIVSPVGAAAGRTNYYVERDASGFNLCSANAPQANQAFSFDYFVTY